MRATPGSILRHTASLLALAALLSPLCAKDLREHLLVVYNSNDPDSVQLAKDYATARSIAPERLLGIPTPITETITREEFNRTLRDPIARHLEERQWMVRQPRNVRINGETISTEQANGNQIWAMALIRGIPLRIQDDPTIVASENVNQPLRTNAAAVDSELALLPVKSYPLPSLVPNPYYHETRIREFNQFLADSFIMVTRLDGPTPDDVRRMIRDSIETEKMELTGRAYFDTRGLRDASSPYTVGDDWIRQARNASLASGFSAVLDEEEAVFNPKQPWEDVALYAGWYENHVRGPFLTPGFRFAPGAVAYHIHSFSAESLRTPDRFWVGPLIHHGAAATMGNVYEPYLRMTPNIGVFFRALLEGLTFAEAGYHSQVGLSWMTTFVGDPLYRPFPRPFLESLRIAESRQDRPADWLLARTLRLLAMQQRDPTEKITTILSAVESRPGPVLWEEGGDIIQELGASWEVSNACYDKAGQSGISGTGRMRLGLKKAQLFQKAGLTEEAMNTYETLLASEPVLAPRYGIPESAIRYASTVGWSRFSPAMKNYLAPVGAPPAQAVPTPTPAPTPAPATGPQLPARPPSPGPSAPPSQPNPLTPPAFKPAAPPPSRPANSPTEAFKPSIQ